VGGGKEKRNEEVWYVGDGEKKKEEGGVLWEEKWRGKERKEKIEMKKLNWFELYVHFV
jgi:hypothetical protein